MIRSVFLASTIVLAPDSNFNFILCRATSFPILLLIAMYERQAKQTGALTFYETVSAAAEKVFDTLPRGLKRMCMSCEGSYT